jgi:GNAT superfamily N-acetyltransferase
MASDELDREIDAGVRFCSYEVDGALTGIMGLQQLYDVDLLRHAYVRPSRQGQGVGSTLLEELRRRSEQPMLVGTWASALWAIRFYERHGFELVAPARGAELLRRHWSIPARQREASVVLASPA